MRLLAQYLSALLAVWIVACLARWEWVRPDPFVASVWMVGVYVAMRVAARWEK